jgi:hypothetical protein
VSQIGSRFVPSVANKTALRGFICMTEHSMSKQEYFFHSFDCLIASWLKCSTSWHITPCTPLKVKRRFGGTCRLHLQGQGIRPVRNNHEAVNNQSSVWQWKFSRNVLPKRWLTFNRLYGVISHKTELFITTVGRNSNLTYLSNLTTLSQLRVLYEVESPYIMHWEGCGWIDQGTVVWRGSGRWLKP